MRPPVDGSYLATLDYLAIGLYLAVTAGIGVWTARRQTSTSEYFVANRRIPAFAVGFALMATTISSVTFVAIPGSVFARNWWQMLYMSAALVVLIFVVRWVVPFYRRQVGLSAYEYLETRFGYAARLYGSAGFILVRVADLGFTLYLTAVAVEVIAGWNIHAVVAAIGVFTLIYTLVGGIEAAIWTSVLQGVFLIGGALLILAVLLLTPPAGPSAVLGVAWDAGKFSLGSFEWGWHTLYFERATAWIFLLAGLLHFGRMYATEQSMVQRYLVARSDTDARRGAMMGVLTTVPVWFAFALIGACLWGFYQTMEVSIPAGIAAKPDTVLPYFIATELPTGLVGVILAALLSAAMSSVSADLNSVAAVATQDYFARALPRTSDAARLWFGRAAVIASGALSTAAALALTLTRSTAAYEVVVISVSVIAGGMLGLFALGFFTRRATRAGAYAGILASLLFVGWATATGPLKLDLGLNFSMNSLLIGILSHVVLFGVGYAVSVVLGGHLPDLTGLTVWDVPGKQAVGRAATARLTGSAERQSSRVRSRATPRQSPPQVPD
jgi:SSS family solute:Na+ symporter